MGADDISFAGRVRAIVSNRLLININRITDESLLVEDLGVNPLELTRLIEDCEKEFGIQILDGEAENYSTVGDIITSIKKLLKEQGVRN